MVTPFYQAQPAPMGLADYGLGTNGPFSYNTSHINAQVTFNAPPNATAPGSEAVIVPAGQTLGYVGSPYEFSIQLNTVTNNMSIPGSNDGTFWTQNVLDMNDTGIHFVDDVFNLTGPVTTFQPGSIASGCSMNVSDILATYGGVYQCVGTTVPVAPADFPLTISLYNNATVNSANKSQVSFGYRFTGAGGYLETGVSDVVVFANPNATAPPHKAGFSIDGFQATPSGLLRDAEVILGGPIGGANAAFNSLSGSMSLLYSNASVGSWKEIPSAYDFGTDTGETSFGVAAYWTAGHLEELNQGPSMLYGLWSGLPWASVPSGDIQFQGSISPTYGFVFLSNVAPGGLGTNLSFVPTTSTGTFDTLLPPVVPPGTQYFVQSFADGFHELNSTPFSTTQLGYTITLTSAHGNNPAPLYANGNAQAASLALNVLGASAPPYVYTGLTVDLNLTFNHLNEYSFPSFALFQEQAVTSTVFVNNTVQGPDSPLGTIYYYNFNREATGFLTPGPVLNTTNRPGFSQQFQFLLSSNAHLTNETLSGYAAYGTPFGSGGGVMLWKDSDVTLGRVSSQAGSYGVFVGDSMGTVVRNVIAASGANAVDDVGSHGTTVWNATVSGSGSFGVYVLASTDGVYLWFNTSADGTGVFAGDYSGSTYYSFPGAIAAEVAHLTATSGADGVVLIESDAVVVAWVNATSGASGGLSELSDAISYVDVSAKGALGVEVLQDLDDIIEGLHVDDTSTETGAFVEASEFTEIVDTVINGAVTGLVLDQQEFTFIEFLWDNASSGEALSLTDSIDTEVEYLTVNASGTLGASLENDSGFFGEHAATVGPPTYSVAGGSEIELEYGTDATVTAVSGSDGGVGILLDEFNSSSIANTMATDGSLGAIVVNSSWDTVTGSTASTLSIAVGVGDGAHNIEVSQTTVTDESIGVYVLEAGVVRITGVTATNLTLSSPWNTMRDFGAPAAAVVTEYTYQVQVSDVVATNYPIGLYDLESGYTGLPGPGSLAVQNLNATGGWYAVMLNGTAGASFNDIGAYQDYQGVWMGEGASPYLNPADSNYISASSFVDDASYGVAIWDGNGNYIWDSNFIGDNGATSVYSAANVQAFSAPGSYNSFDSPFDPIGNYWADWHAYENPGQLAPYLVSTTSEDEEPLSYPAGDVTVWFYESGLPSGTSWSVTVNGQTQSTTNSALEFGTPDGVYAFSVGAVSGYSVTPGSGNVTTTSGPTTLNLVYTALPPAVPTYPVTLTETGLATGLSWSAIVGGTTRTSATSSITVDEPAGTYAFQIPVVAGYIASPSSGSVVVTGAYNVSVEFTAVKYALTVTESGLTTGTSWSATVNGVVQSTAGTSLTWYLPNGSYVYSVSNVGGYSLSGGSGTIMLTGSPAGVAAAYTPNSTPALVSQDTYNSGLAVAIAIAVVALLIGLLALLWRRKKPEPPSSGPTPWVPPAATGAPPAPSPPAGAPSSSETWSEGPPNPPS